MITIRSLLRVRLTALWIWWYLHLARRRSLNLRSRLPRRLLSRRVRSVGRYLKPLVRARLIALRSDLIDPFRRTPRLYLRLALASLRFRLLTRLPAAPCLRARFTLRLSRLIRFWLGTLPRQTTRVWPGADLRKAV